MLLLFWLQNQCLMCAQSQTNCMFINPPTHEVRRTCSGGRCIACDALCGLLGQHNSSQLVGGSLWPNSQATLAVKVWSGWASGFGVRPGRREGAAAHDGVAQAVVEGPDARARHVELRRVAPALVGRHLVRGHGKACQRTQESTGFDLCAP